MDFVLEAIHLVNQNISPLTWQHALGIVALAMVGYYVMQWIVSYPLLRWAYMGVLVIFIANLFHRGEKGKAVVNIFKLAMV